MKKILLKENNVVFDFGEDIIFAKPGAEDGGLMPCEEAEATHIWNREKDIACMANKEISGITMIEVDEIPEEVEAEKYKYENKQFVINENYIKYHSGEERVEALENIINILLMGGLN